MKIVIDFVEGLVSYDELEAMLYAEPEIWEYLQSLVTEEIKDQSSAFWNDRPHSMWGFCTNNFSVRATLTAFALDHRAHSLISALVTYHDPRIKPKNPPSEAWSDIIDRLKLDHIGGEETDELLRRVIAEHQTEGARAIKAAVKDVFPTASRRIPHWAQEPEWPMGKQRPMQFVKETREGDKNTYVFRDLDGEEVREIVQYY